MRDLLNFNLFENDDRAKCALRKSYRFKDIQIRKEVRSFHYRAIINFIFCFFCFVLSTGNLAFKTVKVVRITSAYAQCLI